MPPYDIVVAYDVLQADALGPALLLAATTLVGVGFVVVVFIMRSERSRFFAAAACVSALGWVSVGVLLGVTTYFRLRTCQDWLASGAYAVDAGIVHDVAALPNVRTSTHAFSVGDVRFLTGYDLSMCGFAGGASGLGPIQEGANVRISHREGAILRLEIAQPR